MSESLVLSCLRMAIKERQPTAGLIHHKDRGIQYDDNEYRSVMKRSRIHDSRSRADNCYDDAFRESPIGTIKTKLEMTEYKNIREALKDVLPYLRYYNLERKHFAIEHLTPVRFEQLTHRLK